MRRLIAVGVAVLALVAVILARGHDPRVLPVDPAAHFEPSFRETAALYASHKYSYWAAGTILRWGLLAGIVSLAGGRTLAATGLRLARGRRFLSSALTAALLLGVLSLATLPLVYGSGFRAEHAFRLSTQSRAEWALDWLKAQAVWIPIYALLAGGFLACLRRWPRRGWIAAAGGGVIVAVVGVALAPRAIDPLFHDFAPLEDRALSQQIVALGREAGLDVERVRVMDASRRTRRLNAYVTGLGVTRQVVLYDNLLAEAPRSELMLVVAHELGHAAEHHVARGLLWSVPAIVLGAWGLAALARGQARRRPWLTGPGDPAGLPLLWLALSVGLFLSSPVQAALSRRMEAQADWISLELTRDPTTFVAAEKRLAERNLSPVDPPGWLVTWLYSHPPVMDRIGMAAYWRATPP